VRKADILIIGAGPAGMMAAIYAQRAGKDIVLLDKNTPGGRINATSQVDNYLGFGKVNAQELVEKMVSHLSDHGIEPCQGVVRKVNPVLGGFQVLTDRDEYFCRAVVIASGTSPKPLGVENEQRLVAKGVSYCAVCDGVFFKDEDVCVIGGGDSALEEANYLTNFVRSVTIIHDLDRLTAARGIVDRTRQNPKISILTATRVTGFTGTDSLSAVQLEDLNSGRKFALPFSGAFIYVGNKADVGFLAGFRVVDEAGFIPVDQEMRTTYPGLFACGDVTKKDFRFIVTAISDGAIAALGAIKYLEESE